MGRDASKDIKVLDGLEAVRLAPFSFLPGRTTQEKYQELLIATIAAALEQHPVHSIRVSIYSGNCFSILDDGPGLAVDLIEYGGFLRPALEVMMMKLSHLDEKRAKSWGFLSGWGPILSATADRLVVRTARGGKRYRAAFARGGLITLLMEDQLSSLQRGTELIWSPDRTVLGDSSFDFDRVQESIEKLKSASSSVELDLRDERNREPNW